MTNLTTASWVKVLLIALLCLVLCTGVGGCFIGIQRSVSNVLGTAHIMGHSSLPNAGDHEFDPSQVRDISINWLAGSVDIVAIDDAASNKIEMRETYRNGSGSIPEAERLRWGLENGVLSIDYYAGQPVSVGLFGCSSTAPKSLTISIPRSYAHSLGKLNISGASGRYDLMELGCESISFDLASGDVSGVALTANDVELDVASGSVSLEGAFSGRLAVDAASGNIDVTCTDVRPSTASISLASGNVQLLTPAASEQGYTVFLERITGEFNCPRAQQQDDLYKVGDGTASYTVDMVSGNVTID